MRAEVLGLLDELQAVVAETETAANRVMAAAEELNQLAENAGAEVGARIVVLTGGIFEASAFRDITGQRLSKVMGRLRGLNGGCSGKGARRPTQASHPAGDERNLLNGPQLANQGCSQADVDALLASFD